MPVDPRRRRVDFEVRRFGTAMVSSDLFAGARTGTPVQIGSARAESGANLTAQLHIASGATSSQGVGQDRRDRLDQRYTPDRRQCPRGRRPPPSALRTRASTGEGGGTRPVSVGDTAVEPPRAAGGLGAINPHRPPAQRRPVNADRRAAATSTGTSHSGEAMSTQHNL
jgi:hypothetical protein